MISAGGTSPQVADSAGAGARSLPTDEADLPQTGDLVIDAALAELASAPSRDLDALIGAGERVQRTLQARLADLGG